MAPPTSPAAVAAAARASPTPAAALALFKSALSADRALCPLSVLPHLAASPSLPHLLLTASATSLSLRGIWRRLEETEAGSAPKDILHPIADTPARRESKSCALRDDVFPDPICSTADGRAGEGADVGLRGDLGL